MRVSCSSSESARRPPPHLPPPHCQPPLEVAPDLDEEDMAERIMRSWAANGVSIAGRTADA